MKHLLITIIIAPLLLPCGQLHAQDIKPQYRLENLPATDGSVQQSLVFRSIPGVVHTVQVSDNLTDWNPYTITGAGDGGEVYGLGGEIVVPLRQFTPPPPPPPGGGGDPPPPGGPAIVASLVLRHATGGGTLASWRSFDHGAGITVHLEDDLHEDWESTPLFWNRYGNYHLFIWQPGTAPAAPPQEAPLLSPADEDFLALLQDRFDDINAQVAAATAAARNAPPPAPPAPGNRRFFRIHSDFTVDSDNDGIPDYLEFRIANDPQHPDHSLGDPFNPDVDGDGVMDNRRVDSDLDGIADFFDASPPDPAIDWEKGPAPRYALFDIQGAPAPFEQGGFPLHVTDGGHVLFPTGIWSAGDFEQLSQSSSTVQDAWASAMLPNGLVVGRGRADLDDNGTYDYPVVVYWPSPQTWPRIVREPGTDHFAYPDASLNGWTDAGNLIGEEGTILAPGLRIVSAGPGAYDVTPLGNTLWELQGEAIGRSPAPEHATRHFNKHILWGEEPGIHRKVVWYHHGDEVTLDRWYRTIARTPGGGFAAMGNEGHPSFSSPERDHAWVKSERLKRTADMSLQGWIALGNSDIWANGFQVPWKQAAPGIPSAWDNHFVYIMDSSPKGNLLLQRHSEVDGGLLGYGMGVPLVLEDAQPATGVDAISVTSEYPGAQPAHRQWIMAPAGGENTLRIKSPACATCELKLEAPGVTLSPDTLTTNDQMITVSAPPGAASSDVDLEIKLGGSSSLSTPIGIKVMKRRTVKPRVWLIPCLKAGGAVSHPTVKPTKTELDNYLTGVFLPQLNASFDCTVTETEPLAFDTADGTAFGAPADRLAPGNGYLDTNNSAIAEYKTIRDQYYDEEANMNIYILGGVMAIKTSVWHATADKLLTSPSFAVGLTNPGTRTCVLVSNLVFGNNPGELKDTIAHEIGHIILGEGHPDEAERKEINGVVEWDKGGVAPLPGTDHIKRQMCSGSQRKKDGTSRLLVKGEWDKAEEWLSENVDK